MKPSRAALILFVATAPVLAGGRALGQSQRKPASDAIGDILAQPPGTTPVVPQEPDTAAATAQPQIPQPPAAAPAPAPAPAGEPPVAPGRDATPYDARVQASFAAAERYQGPLDGGWTLSAAGGDALYIFRLVDHGRGPVEGAWRDPSKVASPEGSGFVDEVSRGGGALTLRFHGAVASLHAAGEDRWSGELVERGQSRPVVLRRTAP